MALSKGTKPSDANIVACEIWAECGMPPVRKEIDHEMGTNAREVSRVGQCHYDWRP